MIVVHQNEFLLIAQNRIGYHHRIEQQSWISSTSFLIHCCDSKIVYGHIHSAVGILRLSVEILLSLAVIETVTDVEIAKVARNIGEGQR